MEIEVLIPTKNRPDFLVLALQSLMFQTQPPKHICVYDQSDTSVMHFPAYRKIVAALDQENIHVHYVYQRRAFSLLAEMRQEAWTQVTYPYVFMLDDDAIVSPDTLEVCGRALVDTGAGLVMATTFDVDKENIRHPYDTGPGEQWCRRDEFLAQQLSTFELPWVNGSGLLVVADCVDAIGGWNFKGCTLPDFEDVLFCYRMKRRWGAYGVRNTRVFHLSTGTDAKFINFAWNYARLAEYCIHMGYTELLNFSGMNHPSFWLQYVKNGPDEEFV